MSRLRLVRPVALAALASLLLADPSSAAPPEGKRFAVLVGVNRYESPRLKPLAFAENDVSELAEMLRDANYEVTLLTGREGADFADRKPTLANVRAALKAVAAQCGPNDTLLVALAGHGLAAPDGDGSFCTADTRPAPGGPEDGLSLGELYRELGRCKAGTRMLLVDACRLPPDKGKSRGLDGNSGPKPPRGVAALFSCSAGQRSYESPDLKHGLFFHHVIAGLQTEERDRAGELSWPDLIRHVLRSVDRDAAKLLGKEARQSPAEATVALPGGAPVLVGRPTAAVERPALSWRFQKGRPFYQKITTTTRQNMTIQNNELRQDQDQTFFMRWTPVGQAPNGNWILRQTIEGVKAKIDIGGNAVTFDSTAANNADSPPTEFFKALVGAEFTLTLDAHMRVVKVEGREAFLARLEKANPQSAPLLKQLLSEDALKQMGGSSFDSLPGRPVKPGDSWQKTSALDMGPIGSYRTELRYTLTSLNGDVARMDLKGDMIYRAPPPNADGLPFRIKDADLKGKGLRGFVVFDLARGRTRSSEMKLNIEGSLTIDIGGNDTKVGLKQEQTTTTETADKSFLK